jgi:hypothetical protein
MKYQHQWRIERQLMGEKLIRRSNGMSSGGVKQSKQCNNNQWLKMAISDNQ